MGDREKWLLGERGEGEGLMFVRFRAGDIPALSPKLLHKVLVVDLSDSAGPVTPAFLDDAQTFEEVLETFEQMGKAVLYLVLTLIDEGKVRYLLYVADIPEAATFIAERCQGRNIEFSYENDPDWSFYRAEAEAFGIDWRQH